MKHNFFLILPKSYVGLCFINQLVSNICVLYVNGIRLDYFQKQTCQVYLGAKFLLGRCVSKIKYESCIPG